MFYIGMDNKIHYAEQVNADNPVECPNLWGENYSSYKTDDTGNNNKTDEPKANGNVEKVKEKSATAFIFPNPSRSEFTITLEGLEDNATIDLKIQSTDGRIIYTNFTTGSNHKQIVWNASSVGGGVYYYTIRINEGEIISGKLIKM